MTRAYDINQLIAEEASGPSERRALEEMAHRLDDTLSADVPYRPEFKAQLRKQLMAQARRQLTPWYRRPSFLGSSVAVAAAAAVLFVGLNMWQQDLPEIVPGAPEVAPNEKIAQPQPEAPKAFLVSEQLRDVPVVHLADEPQTTAVLSASTAAEAGQGMLQLKRLTARPDEEQFRTMANRLAFRGESRRTSDGWMITDEAKTLTMTEDGKVGYSNSSPAVPPNAQEIDADRARQVAHQFLDRAVLPIPTRQPVVTPEGEAFTVIYTEIVEGRPVVNARTIIQVNNQGAVLKAEAYVSSGTSTQGTYQALTEAEGLAEARSGGGTFDRADLVWVRTPGDSTVYLQPYWRAYGTDSAGAPVVRYVPALKR
ncbi:MAG: hypothetical protein ACOY94_27240 [Bacillota bacterium]